MKRERERESCVGSFTCRKAQSKNKTCNIDFFKYFLSKYGINYNLKIHVHERWPVDLIQELNCILKKNLVCFIMKSCVHTAVISKGKISILIVYF